MAWSRRADTRPTTTHGAVAAHSGRRPACGGGTTRVGGGGVATKVARVGSMAHEKEQVVARWPRASTVPP